MKSISHVKRFISIVTIESNLLFTNIFVFSSCIISTASSCGSIKDDSIKHDPGETNNLAVWFPDHVNHLINALTNWESEVFH